MTNNKKELEVRADEEVDHGAARRVRDGRADAALARVADAVGDPAAPGRHAQGDDLELELGVFRAVAGVVDLGGGAGRFGGVFPRWTNLWVLVDKHGYSFWLVTCTEQALEF